MSQIIRHEQQGTLATFAPIDRFDELLQQGQIAEALDLRMDAIESSAHEHRTDCEAAKLSAAGLAAAGLLMSASPVIGLLGGLGAIAYGAVLFQDYQKTKRFCPIPAIRKTLPEMLTGVGNAADRGALPEGIRVESKQVEDPLADVLGFLEPAIAHEYELLQVREMEMQRYLEQFPPAKRLLAYRVALRQTRLRSTLSLPTLQQAATLDENLQPIAAPEPPIEYANYAPAATDEPAPTDAIDVPATEIHQPTAAPEPTASPDSRTPPPITTAAPGSTHEAAEVDRFAWARDLLHFPAVLIWGAQGSGKTSFAAWLLHQRIEAGHSAEVWDVHREFGQWDGLPVYGDGMDYEAVDRRMLAFEGQVKADYKERSKNPNYSPKRHTIAVEEFTNFARRCEHSAPFFEAALSDIRKVKKGVIFVSHDRSLAALGGSKGFSKARNNGLLELQLEAIIDPATGDPMPALKGKLRYPGKPAIAVEISREMCGSMNFTKAIATPQPAAQTEAITDRLNRLLQQDYQPQPAPAIEIPNCPSDAAATAEFIEFAELSRKLDGFITASKVKSSVWKYRAVDADKIREIFLQMHRLGIGKTRGSGTSLEWSIVDVS